MMSFLLYYLFFKFLYLILLTISTAYQGGFRKGWIQTGRAESEILPG